MSDASAPGGAAAVDDNQPRYLEHKQIVVVMIGLMTGVLLAALDQSIVGTALPRIVSDLGGLSCRPPRCRRGRRSSVRARFWTRRNR